MGEAEHFGSILARVCPRRPTTATPGRVEVHIPIRVSGPNLREHHFARKRRVADERAAVRGSLLVQAGPDWRTRVGPPPYYVTMTRVGPREYDDDNLAGACKAIRDQIAAELGHGDGPKDPITWRYAQRRGNYSVEVVIVWGATPT